MLRRMLISITPFALALGACAAGPEGDPDGGAEVSVVDIGGCQTVQGTQPYASPQGIDYTEQLKEAGILHVGSDNDYPPFESIPPGAEEPEGFDVDLYTELADRLELEARSTTTDFDALFTESIPNNVYDLGISAITITEDRKGTVDFTVPYFRSDLSLAVNAEQTPEILGIDDIAGLTIGAQKGTTGEACAQVLVDDGRAAEVKSYGTASAAFQDLEAGRIAGVVNDQQATIGFIEQAPDALRVVQIIRTDEVYGFAISKDKPDLRVKIDEVLTEMMNDGTYAEIYERWFDTPPPYDVPIG